MTKVKDVPRFIGIHNLHLDNRSSHEPVSKLPSATKPVEVVTPKVAMERAAKGLPIGVRPTIAVYNGDYIVRNPDSIDPVEYDELIDEYAVLKEKYQDMEAKTKEAYKKFDSDQKAAFNARLKDIASDIVNQVKGNP